MHRRDVVAGQQATGGDSGMVLPFVPSVVTFQDIHYFVDVPKVILPGQGTGSQLGFQRGWRAALFCVF